jgi:hypothetical protein
LLVAEDMQLRLQGWLYKANTRGPAVNKLLLHRRYAKLEGTYLLLAVDEHSEPSKRLDLGDATVSELDVSWRAMAQRLVSNSHLYSTAAPQKCLRSGFGAVRSRHRAPSISTSPAFHTQSRDWLSGRPVLALACRNHTTGCPLKLRLAFDSAEERRRWTAAMKVGGAYALARAACMCEGGWSLCVGACSMHGCATCAVLRRPPP